MSSTAGALRSPAFSVNSVASPAATKASFITGFISIILTRVTITHSRIGPFDEPLRTIHGRATRCSESESE